MIAIKKVGQAKHPLDHILQIAENQDYHKIRYAIVKEIFRVDPAVKQRCRVELALGRM